MRWSLLVFICVTAVKLDRGQDNAAGYDQLVEKADSLHKFNKYKESAFTYSKAFELNGWLAPIYDRYNAACSWALAGYSDSAFYNLQRVANKGYYFKEKDIES